MIREFKGEYDWLSNFYLSVVWFEGVEYASVEHAYQAAKTIDDDERKKVADCSTAGKAKRVGRKVTLRDDWDKVKIDVMYGLLWQKFGTSPLKEKLLETDDAELIEGNHWGDTFWGVCKGKGENWLGKLLMIVRGERAE